MGHTPVRFHGAVIVTLVTLAVGVNAQTQRRPTAVTLRGLVVADDSGASIPYARLRVSEANSSVRGDADGHFALELPDRGTLVISKAGFVTVEHELPLRAGTTGFRLIRAAALAGRVTNEFGEPIVAARVLALGPNSGVSSAPNANTDDRGEYRIGGLSSTSVA